MTKLPYGSLAGPVAPKFPTKTWNKIIIVGEAPGATEVINDLPFAGPSGEMLSKLMQLAGLDREATLITNVFPYQPTWTVNTNGQKKNNDIEAFFTNDMALCDTTLAKYRGKWIHKDHKPFVDQLHTLIHNNQPTKLIALGATALWALTGNDQMSSVRGHIVPYIQDPQLPVIATWHTAYPLYQKEQSVEDTIARDLSQAT
jgi:uracil-DNA glycosylase